MAAIEVKFHVHITEYERGWGPRDSGDFYFDTKEKAEEYVKTFNARNNLPTAPDWYEVADYVGAVDAQTKKPL